MFSYFFQLYPIVKISVHLLFLVSKRSTPIAASKPPVNAAINPKTRCAPKLIITLPFCVPYPDVVQVICCTTPCRHTV